MDSFFTRAGCTIAFQPFAHQVDFDAKLKERRPAYLFIPHWYFRKFGRDLHLQPFLLPLRRGAASYRKVLLTSEQSKVTLENLKNHSLAMTSMGPDTEGILNSILFSRYGVDARGLSTVMVSKDSDALFALALGHVDMALAVKENMDQVAGINPKIMQFLHPLAESEAIPMPVFCYVEEAVSPSEVQKLKDVFLNPDKKEMRTRIMELLQIDEWRTYSE